MMKQNYKVNKPYGFICDGEWVEYNTPGKYTNKYQWMRTPRTHLNRKRLAAYPEFTRAKQRKLPSNWDDMRLSFGFGSDWKRFTKKRKQYL